MQAQLITPKNNSNLGGLMHNQQMQHGAIIQGNRALDNVMKKQSINSGRRVQNNSTSIRQNNNSNASGIMKKKGLISPDHG